MTGVLSSRPPQASILAFGLGGSEGGVPARRAAWLASYGYAAFALAYFGDEGLPSKLEAIPLEYFDSAIDRMMQRPEIDPAQIGVVGASRGWELALQLGSMYPQIQAVVAYVPANLRYESCCDRSGKAAWTWHGRALSYSIPGHFTGHRDSPAERDAAIAVENPRTNPDDLGEGRWSLAVGGDGRVPPIWRSHRQIGDPPRANNVFDAGCPIHRALVHRDG